MLRRKLVKSIALVLSFVLLLPNQPVGAAEGSYPEQETSYESSLLPSDTSPILPEDFSLNSDLLDQEKAWIEQELNS
ncbi:hypothetical protein [Paenibacillus sp. FSL R5-0914]|uniref:hypothetical protein n=1 Tax=Paenibacillus sp. FSL R5-0914 TaxID=2921665 RepID=UPI0030F831D1